MCPTWKDMSKQQCSTLGPNNRFQGLQIRNVISNCHPLEAEVSWGDGSKKKLDLLFNFCLEIKDRCV